MNKGDEIRARDGQLLAVVLEKWDRPGKSTVYEIRHISTGDLYHCYGRRMVAHAVREWKRDWQKEKAA